MVWEQESTLIIMLTLTTEAGKVRTSGIDPLQCVFTGSYSFYNCLHRPYGTQNYFIVVFSFVQVKCCKYWPDVKSTIAFGPYEVRCVSEQLDQTYITRYFTLRNIKVCNSTDMSH